MTLEIMCGWEPREAIGGAVAWFSAIRRTTKPLSFQPMMEKPLRYEGLYRRPHEERNGQLWDLISDAPMSTSFANSRFLVPWKMREDWALWCDFVDMMWMADPTELFDMRDDKYAVMVVKREHKHDGDVKMDGQIQTYYTRKNWSSVILWNLRHAGNARLTIEMVNELPGRDLHRFCWLNDDEIGELPPEWNYLVDVDPMTIKPKLLHFTLGLPTMAGHEDGPWADVWKQELAILDSTRGLLEAP